MRASPKVRSDGKMAVSTMISYQALPAPRARFVPDALPLVAIVVGLLVVFLRERSRSSLYDYRPMEAQWPAT